MKHRLSTPQQITADLFANSTSYPGLPGHKGRSETSREAAEAIAPRAPTLRGKIADLLVNVYPGGHTPDEAASALRLSPFAVRPRFTELSAAGLIKKTGERRRNPGSTLNATVWRASALLLPSVDSPPLAFCPSTKREAGND